MIFRITHIFLIVFLVTGASVFAQEHAYKIEVKVDKFQGKVCYLGYPYGPKKYLADTAEINSEGKFVFEGKKPSMGVYILFIAPLRKVCILIWL